MLRRPTSKLLHIGSGSLFNLNNADDSRAYAYDSSGALYAFSGAAEAFGANPPEDTAILPLQGAAGVAFAPNWIAEGTVKTEAQQSRDRQILGMDLAPIPSRLVVRESPTITAASRMFYCSSGL